MTTRHHTTLTHWEEDDAPGGFDFALDVGSWSLDPAPAVSGHFPRLPPGPLPMRGYTTRVDWSTGVPRFVEATPSSIDE